MHELKGVIQNGQVVLSLPADLPDGTEVAILPIEPRRLNDDQPPSPEEIARSLLLLDQLEPFAITDEECAMLEMDRRQRKEQEKARFQEHADKLRSCWE